MKAIKGIPSCNISNTDNLYQNGKINFDNGKFVWEFAPRGIEKSIPFCCLFPSGLNEGGIVIFSPHRHSYGLPPCDINMFHGNLNNNIMAWPSYGGVFGYRVDTKITNNTRAKIPTPEVYNIESPQLFAISGPVRFLGLTRVTRK
jgi:hypothetical protein